MPSTLVPLFPEAPDAPEKPPTFKWGGFPPIAQTIEHKPGVHRKRFHRLLNEACDLPVELNDGTRMTVAHALVEILVNDALAGDSKAMQTILDRVDGKAVQGLDFSTASGAPSDGGTAVSAFFAKVLEMAGPTEDAEVVKTEATMTDLELMAEGKFGDAAGK